jgi:hypothetical protein
MGQALDIDFDEAFSRMLQSRPRGDIEFWASQEVGYACRTRLSDKDARAKHRKAIVKYSKRSKEGRLPSRDLGRLTNQSNVVPVNELSRPSPNQFDKNSVFSRVAEMGRRA